MMLSSYLKIAGRSFLKQRLYSLINVVGLAIGLTCSLLIALYVADELSFDRQHPDAERIYRFSQTYTALDAPIYLGSGAPQVGPLLKDAFPEVEDFTRLRGSTRVFTGADGTPRDERIFFADASVFDFFAFTWLEGDPETALVEPNSVVLTRSFARRYFGEADALGQSLAMDNDPQVQVRVTGLIEDMPHNMHVRAGAFVSLSSMPALMGVNTLENWGNVNFSTYLKLAPPARFAGLEQVFGDYLLRNMPEPERANWTFSGIALPDIHLYAPATPGERANANLTKVLTLSAIAVVLLLIAGINFVNLSAARAIQRRKEVAVRKVLGSSRVQLFVQFMGEALLMVLVAFLLALVLVEIALPALNAFTGKNMGIGTLAASLPAAAVLLTAVASIALLAGCYPALYLSALRPGDAAIRGAGGGVLSFRNVLVIFQFAVSVILVVATLVVYAQVRLARNIDLGFDKDEILVLYVPDSQTNTWPAFRNELLQVPGVNAATASSSRPFEVFIRERDMRFEGGTQPTVLTEIEVEYEFFETYQVPVLAGRLFSEAFRGERTVLPTDASPQGTAAFILNRAAVEAFGWSAEEAIGKWVERDDSEDFSRTVRGQVIGVVEDMRFDSLREAIKPVFFMLPPEGSMLNSVSLRLSGASLPATLEGIDAAWKRFHPGQPVNRVFLDTEFQAMYDEEQRFVQLLGTFAGFSIFISCMGLFGLTAFAVERRIREIGVRKVMGSSVWGVILLFTNEVSRLVLLANLIAWPVAYLMMERWLESFAYRVDLTPLVFIGSGAVALCIAWVTVGGTAAKAASAKPALALRYE